MKYLTIQEFLADEQPVKCLCFPGHIDRIAVGMQEIGQPLDAQQTHVGGWSIKPVEGNMGNQIDPFFANSAQQLPAWIFRNPLKQIFSLTRITSGLYSSSCSMEIFS